MKKTYSTVLLILMTSHSSDSCSCKKIGVAKAVKTFSTILATHIFTVSASQKRPAKEESGWFFGGFRIIKASVTHKFKGGPNNQKADTLYIVTSSGEASCGYDFKPGQDYIIYGDWMPDSVSQAVSPQKLLSVSLCSRTRPYSSLEALRIKLSSKANREFSSNSNP